MTFPTSPVGQDGPPLSVLGRDRSQLEAGDLRPIVALERAALRAIVHRAPYDDLADAALLDVDEVHPAILRCARAAFGRGRGLRLFVRLRLARHGLARHAGGADGEARDTPAKRQCAAGQ